MLNGGDACGHRHPLVVLALGIGTDGREVSCFKSGRECAGPLLRLARSRSADEVGSYDTKEFAGGDDLGVLPEPGEMALIACH